MIDLSVCILTWNTKDLTIKCIESIINNTERISYEIILVDNGSIDGTVEYIEKNYKEIILIKNKVNIGFTRGNNQALHQARGRYSILLNNDTEIEKNCLDMMIEYMDMDKDVGMACCKMYYPDGTLYYNIHENFPSWKNVLAERSILTELFYDSKLHNYFYKKYFITDNKEFEKDRLISWGLGAFLVVRKEVIDKIGLLDETLFIYFEEIDWCKRTIEAGWKIKYYHKPVVIHHTAKSIVQEYSKMTQVWHHSRFYFFYKHYSKLQMIFLKIITSAGIFVRLLKYRRQIKREDDKEKRDNLIELYECYKKILKMSLLYPKYKVNYE